MPHIGDDDGGALSPMTGRAPDDMRDSLAVAAALLDRPDLRIGAAPEEAFWLLGHPHSARSAIVAIRSRRSCASAALADTGYYVSRIAAAITS